MSKYFFEKVTSFIQVTVVWLNIFSFICRINRSLLQEEQETPLTKVKKIRGPNDSTKVSTHNERKEGGAGKIKSIFQLPPKSKENPVVLTNVRSISTDTLLSPKVPNKSRHAKRLSSACPGVVIKCPFSGIAIEEENWPKKTSSNLLEVSTIESLASQLSNEEQEIEQRKRKQGVIDPPEIIERRSAEEKKSEAPKPLPPPPLSSKAFDTEISKPEKLSFAETQALLNTFQISSSDWKNSEGECPARRRLQTSNPEVSINNPSVTSSSSFKSLCPGTSDSSKLFGSTGALIDKRLLGASSPTPPSGELRKEVRERSRSSDNTCAMYGMLLLSACQFGQVRYFCSRMYNFTEQQRWINKEKFLI